MQPKQSPALGFVASYTRPGGNVTGFSAFEPSMGGKWVEILNDLEPPWRQAVERSVQDHCDVSDKPEIGRDAFSPYNHRGTVVVASAWLVFYVIAAIHHFIAS